MSAHDQSPQQARAKRDTEYAWRAIEQEFGMLSDDEAAELVSGRPGPAGSLIGVEQPGGTRYPGFQIDPKTRHVYPVMEGLIRIARNAGLSDGSLVLWMCTPTGYLDGARPVDRLDRPEQVTRAAEDAFNVQW